MTSRWPMLGVAGLLLLTSPAVGQSLYVGGGVGGGFFSSEFEDALDQIRAIDENAVAWKLFGGFSPLRFLGIEGGYRHFGTPPAGPATFSRAVGAGVVEVAPPPGRKGDRQNRHYH